jgi:exportin-T
VRDEVGLTPRTAWIDINLVITPHTIPLIFQCLQMPQLNICTAAVDACLETVAKGMPSADKFELIRILTIPDVCRSLLDAAYARDLEDPDEIIFRLRLARLLNTTGLELLKVGADSAVGQDLKVEAFGSARGLLGMALRFLQDGDLGICGAVVPLLTTQLQDFKRQKKVSRLPFGEDQVAFLAELLDIVIRRMEFPEDADWNGVVDDEGTDDNAAFLDLRSSLRGLFDSVAFLDDHLFARHVSPVITGVLDALAAGNAASLSWQRVELVLYILWVWGEADRSASSRQPLDAAVLNRLVQPAASASRRSSRSQRRSSTRRKSSAIIRSTIPPCRPRRWATFSSAPSPRPSPLSPIRPCRYNSSSAPSAITTSSPLSPRPSPTSCRCTATSGASR